MRSVIQKYRDKSSISIKFTFKYILWLFMLSSFVFPQNSFSQDSSSIINSNWTNLKTQLQRRIDIIIVLTNELSKSPKIDKEQLNNSKTYAIELFKYIDTLIFKDSVSISLAYSKNNRLTQAVERILVTLENNKKFRGKIEVTGLLAQLEGCENRITSAKKEYNEVCNEYKRTDLLFGSEKIQNAPEVKF